MRHPAICLFYRNFCSTFVTEQIRTIHTIEAAASIQSIHRFCQPGVQAIVYVYNVRTDLLMKEGIVLLQRRAART